jgi:hypothetical protein
VQRFVKAEMEDVSLGLSWLSGHGLLSLVSGGFGVTIKDTIGRCLRPFKSYINGVDN